LVNKVINKFFLIVLLFSFGIAVPSSKITANASSQLYDEKIYCELDDNIEFENDSIIVIMDKLLSQKNKVHSLDFFGADLFEKITDLTYGNINILNDDFEQILELKLREKNRKSVLEAIDVLENIQGIKYVGPNKIYSFNQSSNDTYYVSNDLWGIDEMHVPEAWDYSTGSSEIRIGVIDSGIASHPDLNANVITGFDFASDNTITNDDIVGHGTHVAGIIGAIGNNNRGVSGVNWNATIVPLQVATSQGEVNDSA
jgi:subtilisin family serine protease